ncbi:MAG: HdeD family acid-resistance protein [Planctomycetia bacterium]|nr:HdeD family acid-resistance protein [Planctomycetia bacterium]
MAANMIRPAEMLQHELHRLRKEWYWFLALGILLILAGTVAIGHSFMATVVAVKLLGFLLLIAGGAQIVSSFWAGRWSGFLLSLLAGILYVVVGGMMVARTLESGLALTLLIGAFFLVGGIFRIVAAMTLRLHHWGWMLLNGVVTALLGLLVLAEWPDSALYIIGLFIGIDMLFNGWFWVMIGFSLRSLPEEQ